MTTVATHPIKRLSRRAWPALLHQVARTVRSRNLFGRGQHLLVAVSGGPDSVALLSLLHRLSPSWSLTLTAVHFNYGLRGEESDGDQEFVTALCRDLDVPLYARRLSVRDRSRGTSLQAIARDLRYRALLEIAEECGADRIAIGHTADDQAETILLWMLRGAGLTGLSGMPVSRDGNIVRPLCETRREEILAYLKHAGLSYRQDSSNAKPLYLRNRIRQEVLPVLRRLAPSSVDALRRLADLCREDNDYLDQHVAALSTAKVQQEGDGSWAIERAFVQQLPLALQRRVVRDVLRRCDALHRPASVRTVHRILHYVMRKGNTPSITVNRTRLAVTKDLVLVTPLGRRGVSRTVMDPIAPEALVIPSQLVWAGTGQTIQVQQLTRNQVGNTAQRQGCIVVDADRISGPLMVRMWQPGDRFHPFGMKGRSKKLQDFFTDLKVPIGARKNIPIVVAPEGIVWIVGFRQDERWAVTAETEHCLVVTASEKSEWEGVL